MEELADIVQEKRGTEQKTVTLYSDQIADIEKVSKRKGTDFSDALRQIIDYRKDHKNQTGRAR